MRDLAQELVKICNYFRRGGKKTVSWQGQGGSGGGVCVSSSGWLIIKTEGRRRCAQLVGPQQVNSRLKIGRLKLVLKLSMEVPRTEQTKPV